MTRTFDIVDGIPVPDVSTLDSSAALERRRVVEKRLGEIRGDASRSAERGALEAENAAHDARLRSHRALVKGQNTRRAIAGVGTPLDDVIRERLSPELVADVETAAMRTIEERERRAAGRKAVKDGA